MNEVLSQSFIRAQATDAAEKAVRDKKAATNPHDVDTPAWQLWRSTYEAQLLHFGAEKLRRAAQRAGQ